MTYVEDRGWIQYSKKMTRPQVLRAFRNNFPGWNYEDRKFRGVLDDEIERVKNVKRKVLEYGERVPARTLDLWSGEDSDTDLDTDAGRMNRIWRRTLMSISDKSESVEPDVTVSKPIYNCFDTDV